MDTGTKRTHLDLVALSDDVAEQLSRHGIPNDGDAVWMALPVLLAALGLDIHGRPLCWGNTSAPCPTDHPGVAPLSEHTCPSKAAGGHYTPGCPRCAELAIGAPPRSAPEWVHRYYQAKAAGDIAFAAEIKGHFGRDGRHTTHCADAGTCSFNW